MPINGTGMNRACMELARLDQGALLVITQWYLASCHWYNLNWCIMFYHRVSFRDITLNLIHKSSVFSASLSYYVTVSWIKSKKDNEILIWLQAETSCKNPRIALSNIIVQKRVLSGLLRRNRRVRNSSVQ